MMKTREYDIFKFRNDNREKIDQIHLKRLIESIKARNLLELRPICVNGDMEIIDGQHRLLAAKALGIDIYYEKKKELLNEDIILMNISKKWTTADFLNYYCKNGSQEYIKLNNFCKTNNITLKVALNLTMGSSKKKNHLFQIGKYIFNNDAAQEEVDICLETIAYIKKMNGYSAYVNSAKFWKAMLILVKHFNFDRHKWKTNLEKMIERIGPRVSTKDYIKMLMEIHNWKNITKISWEEVA